MRYLSVSVRECLCARVRACVRASSGSDFGNRPCCVRCSRLQTFFPPSSLFFELRDVRQHERVRACYATPVIKKKGFKVWRARAGHDWSASRTTEQKIQILAEALKAPPL